MKAGEALRVSQRAYDLETEPVLGITRCVHDDHKLPRKAVFVVGERIYDNLPRGFHETDFEPLDFDFENLGRAALLDITVPLRLGSAQPHYIHIGNIGAEKDAHVAVNLRWNVATWPLIAWESPAIVRGEALEYLPPATISVQGSIQKRQAKRRWTVTFADRPSVKVEARPEKPKGTESHA